MQIFNFVLSVIIAHHNVLTPHISKTHLPIISFNVRELELNWCSKEQSTKKEAPKNPHRKALIFIKQSFPSLWKYTSLSNAVQSK